jgi:hypothetical protein
VLLWIYRGRILKSVQQKKKENPHCPVPGCRTKQPHADDQIVKGMIAEFGPPAKMVSWVRSAIAELGRSISRDLSEGKYFAWFTRMRQPEELYVRTLYALLIATEKELHHIISGETPNGLAGYYRSVNKIVFEGRGLLLDDQPGLSYGTFKPMETLHDGAHVSFKAFLTVIGMKKNPEFLPSQQTYVQHLVTYCKYLDYMEEMFNAGKEKKHVLDGVINLHRPASYWQEQQTKAKTAAAAQAPAT